MKAGVRPTNRLYRRVWFWFTNTRVLRAALAGGAASSLGLLRIWWLPRWLRRRLVRLYLAVEHDSTVRPLTLSENATETLHDPLVLALLRRHWPAGTKAQDVFNLAEDPALGSIIVRALGSPEVDPASRSELVHDAIVLDLAGSQQRMAAALRLAARVPRLILPEHRRPIFERCLRVAARTLDPYERPGLAIEARLAAARLLEANPDLDESALAAIPAGGPIADHVRVVLTTAIVGRSDGRSELFGKVVGRWRPGVEEAIGFAEECDSHVSAADPISVAASNRRLRRVSGVLARASRVMLPPLLGPATIGAAVIGYHVTRHWPHNFTITLTDALAALAILVAVHVVSAELAAGRLSGLIARWTSSPMSLIAAYSCALTLAFISVAAGHNRHLTHVVRAVPLTLAAFIASLMLVLVQLVRRTDPANAARAFERSRRSAYAAAGRRFGRLQRDCLAFREAASTRPFVALVPAITRVERHTELSAQRPGLLIPSVRDLTRLEQRPRWRNETVRLELLNRPGTSVAAGEPIAAIVPTPEATVESQDIRQARKVFRSGRPRRVHETGEAAVLLLNILVAQAEDGDEQTAARVEEALIALIDHHPRGVRSERPATEDARASASVLPAVPALVAVTKRAARVGASHPQRAVREAIAGATKRLLHVGEEGDGVPSLVIGSLLYETREAFPGLATLLWEAGVRAVETRDASALLLTRMAIEQRLREDSGILTEEGVETSARLCVLVVWSDQTAAAHTWDWFTKQTAKADRNERILGSLRIGSAALLAWNPSTVLRVALALSDEIDLAKLKEYVQRPGFAMLEQTVADQYGHYLAADAESAFVSFLDLATVLRASVH